MIAARSRDIVVESEQGKSLGRNPGFFDKLPVGGRKRGFSAVHAAAGQVPTRNIGVFQEQDATVIVGYQNAGPKRHRPRKKGNRVHNPSNDRPGNHPCNRPGRLFADRFPVLHVTIANVVPGHHVKRNL